jgi:hypothetical protein
MPLQMCVFSLLIFLKNNHHGPQWLSTSNRHAPWRLQGGCLPPWGSCNRRVQPPWATAAAVGHCNWLSKLKIFETVI